jgi:hypothetical protein
MKTLLTFLILLCLCYTLLLVDGKAKKGKEASNTRDPSSMVPKALKLNVDILPPLQDVLSELQLSSYIKDFVRIGVTETRLLLKLSAMDFQIMSMEWAGKGFGADQLALLREKIKQLRIMATVSEETVRPELALRDKLAYGRIFLQNGVASYEYALGSFGTPPPIGEQHLRLSSTVVECNATEVNYNGAFVLARRGDCSFLQKALIAKASNASGLLIVNTEDRLDSPASGHGIDRSISESKVLSLGQFAVLGLSNGSWAPLQVALRYQPSSSPNQGLAMHIVPIKCYTGGKCLPMLEEERSLQAEVSWGRVRVSKRSRTTSSRLARTFEFLASTFGAPLPVDTELPLVWTSPIDACSPVANISSEAVSAEVALAAHRGACRFDIKALHAQDAGARVLVVVDIEDQALQRIGARSPEMGYIGIPSILVTAEAGAFMQSSNEGDEVRIELIPAADSSGLDHWLEVAYTEWAEEPKERLMQLQGLRQKFQETESHDIVSWLQRRTNEIDFPARKSIDTDEL